MDINRGDKNRVFLHDLIKITEGTVSEGTIFMHINRETMVKGLFITYFINFMSEGPPLHTEG